MLTISRSVWSAMAIWDIGEEDACKVCEWSPRGAIFNGFALNSDPNSEATVAISLHLNEYASNELYHCFNSLLSTYLTYTDKCSSKSYTSEYSQVRYTISKKCTPWIHP